MVAHKIAELGNLNGWCHRKIGSILSCRLFDSSEEFFQAVTIPSFSLQVKARKASQGGNVACC